MKEKKDTSQTLLFNLMNHIEQSDKIPSLSSAIDIEVNQIPFHLRAHNGAAVLSFESWSNAFAFLKIVRKSEFAKQIRIRKLQSLLEKVDITFYLQNQRFALIGPRAGLVIPKLLTFASLFVRK